MGQGRKPNVPLRLQTVDSSGPTGKMRGNAYQLHEKYLLMARDAHSAGDRVAAENYFQHAEHYYRIISSNGGTATRHDLDAFEGASGEQPEIRHANADGNGQRDGGSGQTSTSPVNGATDGTEPQPY
jgi:hypothetical protein